VNIQILAHISRRCSSLALGIARNNEIDEIKNGQEKKENRDVRAKRA